MRQAVPKIVNRAQMLVVVCLGSAVNQLHWLTLSNLGVVSVKVDSFRVNDAHILAR